MPGGGEVEGLLRPRSVRTLLLLLAVTLLGFLVAGYHPAALDDGVYQAAIQHRLDPELFRADADLFEVRLQGTIFMALMAAVVRITHLPLAPLELAAHLLTVFAFLAACYRIAARCFEQEYERWCGVALVAVLFTLPVTGTELYILDQYLVPRAISAALALFAVDSVLGRKYVMAGILLASALVFHPIIAALGISLCFFLWVPWPWEHSHRAAAAIAIPGGFLFDRSPVPSALHEVIHMHHYCSLARWPWYEWLGIVAPVGLLLWFARLSGSSSSTGERPPLVHLATRTAVFSVFQFAVASLIMLPPALERMRPVEPLRYLLFLYIVMVLLGGGLLARYLLRRHWWRWLVLFVPIASGMFLVQRALFASSPHVEVPGITSSNPWKQAFVWIRNNTPEDAYFALGSLYMTRPQEDRFGFRAMTLRSCLADRIKDSGTVMTSAALAERWRREVAAQEASHEDWTRVSIEDLRRLNTEFGVTWVILEKPNHLDLDCPYQNEALKVCRLE